MLRKTPLALIVLSEYRHRPSHAMITWEAPLPSRLDNRNLPNMREKWSELENRLDISCGMM